MLFNAKIPGADRRFIGVEQQGDIYMLKAGTAQGITLYSEFTIHADHTADSMTNPPLSGCRMRASKVNPFRTTLEPVENDSTITLPIPAYALEVRCGSGQELHVHFSEAVQRVVSVKDIWQAAMSSEDPSFGFIVSDAANAEMLVDIIDIGTEDRKSVV